ncbi:hypothetical protein HMI01_03750 [Halolactibacillus miurensis]|uniref:Sporulation protein, YlmC/YmxH family n=1 Tax=Halolactibacillus miurensis TaxID=306541 RepID=A0A1I6QGN3_9BACI|nr:MULTISPECIES: YlmC/YmxH family sporulation protein [Halolactibacillus]GEM03387.1 hypothetical protein HMI01_03750 [Halolactibacillus miurensis]SFS51450.1 sporulation protein, YlmC/YmxH family [Halolactibacillus miurensis]
MRFESLKGKEFIEANKGKRLGFIQELDLEFNLMNGEIQQLVIPKYSMLGLRKDEQSLMLSWENIRVIGQDIILIER